MLIQHHSSISPTTSPGALPAHANLGPRPLHVHTTGFSHFHLPLQQPTPASSQPAPSQLQQPLRKPNSCSINRSPNIAHLFANSTSTTCAISNKVALIHTILNEHTASLHSEDSNVRLILQTALANPLATPTTALCPLCDTIETRPNRNTRTRNRTPHTLPHHLAAQKQGAVLQNTTHAKWVECFDTTDNRGQGLRAARDISKNGMPDLRHMGALSAGSTKITAGSYGCRRGRRRGCGWTTSERQTAVVRGTTAVAT